MSIKELPMTDQAPNTSPMTGEAPQEELPQALTCEQLWSMEDQGEKPTILDVREQHEWDAGHVEYATHLPLSQVESDVEKILPNKNELIIACCASGGRSATAVDKMKEMGYTNVKNLTGGFTGYCSKEQEEHIEDEEVEDEQFFAN